MIGVIFAAHTNTSPVLCWLLIMLAQNPLWLSKIQDEIDRFFQLHDINGPSQIDSLAGMNLSLIEEALPSLDLCLHECIRIVMNGTSIRRNVGEDLDIAGRKIRGGDFVMYMLADVHLNNDFYTDPLLFDPGRKHPVDAEFLGWGAGGFLLIPPLLFQ